MTMVGKEAGEVKLKRAAIGFLKADSLEKSLLVLGFNRAFIDSIVNAAEVNKIESSSAKHEKCFKIIGADSGGNVKNESSLGGKLKLRNAAKLAVNRYGVGEKVGIIGYAAELADFLLLCFCLNR